MHIFAALDLKQLPPATSNPPFIAGDPEFQKVFEFRVLHQNRRLTVGSTEEDKQMLDTFHGVLEDVAHGSDTQRARKALTDAYVRGAKRNQETCHLKTALRVWPNDATAIGGMVKPSPGLANDMVDLFE